MQRPRSAAQLIAQENNPELGGDKKVVVVFTGNSNTGTHVIQSLLARYSDAVQVRAVVRTANARGNRKHDAVYEKFGDAIEIVVADVTNKSQMETLLADVKVAFWSTPDNDRADRVSLTRTFLVECALNGVDHPIVISMVGAGNDSHEGEIPEHLEEMGEVENIARQLAGFKTTLRRDSHLDGGSKVLEPVILRCGQFYENFYGMASLFEHGTLHFPLGTSGRMPAVSLVDVGDVVAKIVMDPSRYRTNAARPAWNLIGKFLTGGDVARAFTMANYGTKFDGDISDEMAVMAFAKAHMSQRHAKRYIEVLKYYRERWPGDPTDEFIPDDDVTTILGRRPTPISRFASLMAPLLIAKRDDDLDPILEAFKRGWVTWNDTVINVNSLAC